jgi:hypothetical protein
MRRPTDCNCLRPGKHEIGVIAKEVGAVVPEVVSYEENGKDARGVDYSRLTALLIEALKQQQRENLWPAKSNCKAGQRRKQRWNRGWNARTPPR